MTFKTALVTGGGRSIGAAISKRLAARGANVIVNYLSNKESAEIVVSEIKARKDAAGHMAGGSGGDALAIQADVRDANQVQRMVDEGIKQYGNIDILVSNANVSQYRLKPFLETTWDDFSQRFADEMKAAYEVTRAVLPSMIKKHYGKLIYITSGSARYTMPNVRCVGALGGDNIAVDQPFNWSGNSWCNGLCKMGLCRETFLILWLHMLLTKCMFGFPFFCFHRP